MIKTYLCPISQIPMNFYFEYAYDTTRWNKDNLKEFLELWAAREFGEDMAVETASVVQRYTLYVSRQKPELTSPDTYSLTGRFIFFWVLKA